jgi:hypothetical protein
MVEKYSWYHEHVGNWIIAYGHGISTLGKLERDTLDTLTLRPVLLNNPRLSWDKDGNLKSNACYRLEEKRPVTVDVRAIQLIEPVTEERAKYLIEVTNNPPSSDTAKIS